MVAVVADSLTKGSYNSIDSLGFSDIQGVDEVYQDLVINGENSKIKESLLAKPIKYLGSKGFCRFSAVCMLTTPPTKNDIKISQVSI